MDYSFTASVEKEFDEIAQGMEAWTKMIDRFYKPFHKDVDKTLENAERVKGERVIGNDPVSGKPIIGRIGRYGPLVQIGDQEDEDKKFASLRSGQSLETLTLEQALELFKLPRTIGSYQQTPVTAAIGKFGPYIKFGSLFASIPKDKDIFEITIEEAIELIDNKIKSEAEKVLKTFKEDADLEILKGRWGPYIAYKRNNYKLPKDSNLDQLTFESVMAMVQAQSKGKVGANAEPKTKAKAKAKAAPKAKAKAKAKSKK
jgi:DNA topoisomerase-1